MDRPLIARLTAHLERRVALSLSVADRELYVSFGSESAAGRLAKLEV